MIVMLYTQNINQSIHYEIVPGSHLTEQLINSFLFINVVAIYIKILLMKYAKSDKSTRGVP